MKFTTLANILFLQSSAIAQLQGQGQASYDTNPTEENGKCSYPAHTYSKFTSIGVPNFKNSQTCGMCLQVINTDTQKSTIVHVVDQCQSCGENDLNLNLEAFNEIGDTSKGRINIQWHTVPCDDTQGNIQYYWQANSNEWNGAFQVRNTKLPVSSIQVQTKPNQWENLTLRGDNYWAIKNLPDSNISIKLTCEGGETIEDTIPILSQGGIVSSQKQF
jgi:expansin (peptidoglycan-binding protein)